MVSFAQGDALVLVDVQNDFLPGGALPVPESDAVFEALDVSLSAASAFGVPVFATRDWHPPNHCSFLAEGGPWPPHCIQGTSGAELSPRLRLPASSRLVNKAMTKERDAYSAFDGTELDARLRELGIRRIFVGGLATDYCVLETVRDAMRLGYRVVVLEDAVKPIDTQAGERALETMKGLGAVFTRALETGA